MQNQENIEMISGAEALMRALVAEGVDLVFGYPGGAILPVYDALYDYQDKLQHILVRHEQGAIHAAEGYARATNRPGVVIVTSGPGVANTITGLADAVMDSTPVVVISGQVSNNMLGSDAFQETDVVGITHPITKWALQVRHAEDIPAAVAKAFYIASTGRPGPVVLDISKEAQLGLVEWKYEKLRFIRSYNPRPNLKMANIEKAAEMLNNAERPLILAGHGIMIAEAENEMRALIEKTGIPVATTLLGLSVLPSDHPLNKGMLGMHGNIGPNFLTNQADVILAIGMRFDDRVTLDTNRYARQAKKIHIDIDRSEFHRHVPVDLKIHADAKDALNALMPLVKPNAHHAWCERFDKCNAVEDRLVKETELHHDGPLTMGEVAEAITRATNNEAVLVTDVGQNQMMSARYFKYSIPRSIITSGGAGTMGYGLPAAIGAKMGVPNRTVVYFGGDGGFQMTMQELGTIMQYGTAVKMVVCDNAFLGNVRQWQELFYHSRFSQTPMVNPNFSDLAKVYGIATETVENRQDLEGAVKRMLDHDGPFLLVAKIEPTDMVFPMIPVGGTVEDIMINRIEKFKYPE